MKKDIFFFYFLSKLALSIFKNKINQMLLKIWLFKI